MAEVGRPQGADTPDGRARLCPECGRRAEVEWPSGWFPDPHAECTAPEECGWTGSLSETAASSGAGSATSPEALALIDELIDVLAFLETVIPGRVASRAMWESWRARRAALASGGTATASDAKSGGRDRDDSGGTAAPTDEVLLRIACVARNDGHEQHAIARWGEELAPVVTALRDALAARIPQPSDDEPHCELCGRFRSPWHDADGPRMRDPHPFTPAPTDPQPAPGLPGDDHWHAACASGRGDPDCAWCNEPAPDGEETP